MMTTNLLAVVTPPSIYHACSTRKTLREENFTYEENFISDVNMQNCGRRNVRKHREIKGSDKYVSLDISLKFDSLDKMKIKSSESRDNLRRSGKEFITSLGIKAKARPEKYKSQGMPSGVSVRRTFQRLLGSLKKYLIKVMRRRGPNMSVMTATFTHQYSLQSV